MKLQNIIESWSKGKKATRKAFDDKVLYFIGENSVLEMITAQGDIINALFTIEDLKANDWILKD